jgi:BirA family biotin operon repressor/biotin-[acetyl-CoA-carboxylase] ligase
LIMDIRENILLTLRACDSFISGEELARRLSITRTSVWKHINELRELGYDIEAASHHGYLLRGVPDRLYDWEVHNGLHTAFLGKEYFYYSNLDSTMDTVFRLGLDGRPEGAVVLAESQNKGRGRFRREWISTRYQGLYFSFLLRPSISPAEAAKLTLVVSVGCSRAIKAVTGIDCEVKWPNDIFTGHRKVCGILTEMNAGPDTVRFVVVGVGLNVNSLNRDLPPEATSLAVAAGKTFDRCALLRCILSELESVYLEFRRNGFAAVRDEWRGRCPLWGELVRIRLLNREIQGVAVDLDDDGALLVRTGAGIIERVLSGDVERLRT